MRDHIGPTKSKHQRKDFTTAMLRSALLARSSVVCAGLSLIGKISSQNAEENSTPKYGKDLSNIVIFAGSASEALTKKICDELGTKPGHIELLRFADGEVYPKILESIRGKHVFIVQSCAAPVNVSIMELLLTITAARRADAGTVTAVIPYFGYKHQRRGLPLSTTYHSRFLWSVAGDFAKMLQTSGVDTIVSVDLQRPGQGHEACFFDSQIPVETIIANDEFVKYFKENCDLQSPVVVVSPNTECVKKAKKFQKKLKASTGLEVVDYAAFVYDHSASNTPTQGPKKFDAYKATAADSEFLGDVQGADVVIVGDMVDTAGNLYILCRRLKKEGARRVFICASHGLFTKNSMELIDLSPVEKVVVSDSVPLPKKCSPKIAQVSLAPLLARVIESEGRTVVSATDDEIFEIE